MNSGQKVIKYCAITFAVLLIVSIFGGIFSALASLFNLTPVGGTKWKGNAGSANTVDYTKEFHGIEKLSIDVGEYKLIVKQGETDTVKVEAKNVTNDFKAEVKSDHTLEIDHDTPGFYFFSWGHDVRGVVTVTIPKQSNFRKAFFNIGSGNAEINGLVTDSFELEGGSGAVSISDLTAGKFDLDTGSGAIEISNAKGQDAEAEFGSGSIRMTDCTMENLELSMGSGSFAYDGVLKGDTEIDGASGMIELNIVGDENDYRIECDAGSGGCYLNGDSIDDVKLNRGAENGLSIDGGSGTVEIKFIEK